MSRLEELDAVYIESGLEAYQMCQRLEQDFATAYGCRAVRMDPKLYVGLDTETEPAPGGISDDALRWWGENPGRPFLYIVGWSTDLGSTKPTYFAIPDEFAWAFQRVADFANAHIDVLEWVFFNRIFDLGMVERSAGIKLEGKTHEAFTAMRVACFLPDWFEANKLKVIASTFLDPHAGDAEDNLKLWKAAYESNRTKDLTVRLQTLGRDPDTHKWVNKDLQFSRTKLNTFLEEGLELPLHVKHLYEQWQKDWPPFSYAMVPKHILIPYAVTDVRLTLWEWWVGMQLIKQRGLEHIYEEEQEFFQIAREQVIQGWRVDRPAILKAKDEAERRIGEITGLLKVLFDYFNCTTLSADQKEKGFNPGSGPQMLKLFANIGLNVPNLKATTILKWVEDSKGQRTEWADAIDAYQDFKLYSKLYGTYIEVLAHWSQWDGICHPGIRPDGAFTGRQSVRQPALQTIPRKEVPEFNIRQFFMPDDAAEDRLWMFDFSGMEVGVFAEYCRDPVMLGALAAGADFHSMLALKAFEVARNLVENTLQNMLSHGDVTRVTYDGAIQRLHDDNSVDYVLLEQIKEYMEKNLEKSYKRYKKYRQAAKTGMFSILYGSGDETLAEQMTDLSGVYISIEMAGQFKRAFFDLYKGAREFVNACNEQVAMRYAMAPIHQHNRTFGWARNLYGRLYLIDRRDSYKLPNWLVQGTCADLMKRKMIEINKMLREGGYKSRMILSIHDEVAMNMKKSEEREVVPKIIAIMEDIPELQAVKLKAEASFCKSNWATKKTFHSWEQMEEVLKAA